MSVCSWGHQDCINEGTERCDTCFSDSYHYKQKTKKKFYNLAHRSREKDNRKGSEFEAKTKKVISDALSDKPVVQLTINSGATVYEKGDVQIEGLVTAMIEDKTQTVVHKAKGQKTFTIKKDWLTKLLRESKQHNKEFHWLLFNFLETDNDIYAITEADHIISMAKTMESDRRELKKAEKRAEIANRRVNLVEAENVKLKAELEYLKVCKELMEYVNGEKL